MAKTHKEKDEIIKRLRKELKDSKECVAKVAKASSLEHTALGVFKGSDNVFYMSTLKYAADSTEASVIDFEGLGRSYDVALYLAKKKLVEDILFKLEK
jgi:hypothetical protein